VNGAVLITGVSAAGKSTVAQVLAERLPRAAHVRGDTFRRMVVSGRADMTPEPIDEAVRQLHLRYRIAATTADLYADAGFTPIVQDVILGADLERFTKLIRTRPLHVIVLAPDPAAVEHLVEQTVTLLDQVLHRETPRIGLWLDTSRQSPEETVEEILSRIGEARVDDDLP
jgi:chloramphenicol 3-O-phosphotransferase